MRGNRIAVRVVRWGYLESSSIECGDLPETCVFKLLHRAGETKSHHGGDVLTGTRREGEGEKKRADNPKNPETTALLT